jgi:hypothetical protein
MAKGLGRGSKTMEMKICPNCGGYGHVKGEDEVGRPTKEQCESCKGTGLVNDEDEDGKAETKEGS